jgi:hypothetical protein
VGHQGRLIPQALRIHFGLRDLDQVALWGDPNAGLNLHWFGLTDGWYDVQVGEHHLFRLQGDNEPGVDYQVVRLWEDLIDVAPAVLEPVPKALATRLAAGDAWAAWSERAFDTDDDELRETALSWWWNRHLDSGHLRAAPYIGIWRYEDELHIRWRTRFRKDGDPMWESPAGDALISARQFQDELTRFDHELIEAMQARVEQVAAGWRRPEIRIDIEQLRREQAHRSARLQTAMSTPVARKHTWDDVLAAVAELERRIGG